MAHPPVHASEIVVILVTDHALKMMLCKNSRRMNRAALAKSLGYVANVLTLNREVANELFTVR